MTASPTQKKNLEFIALMALLMSLVAFTIDAILPALGPMSKSLKVENPNEAQFIVSSVFLGMSLGLMIFGPFSDSFGRKNAIFLGGSIFLWGCGISLISSNLSIMLIGRILQGFGAASCRVVTLAMIRDRFAGAEMARIMSLILIIFVLVPALAPSIGQLILLFASWRLIFVLLMGAGLIGLLWLKLRQEETLAKEKRIPFSMGHIFSGVKETVKNPVSIGCTIASGVVFGPFIAYLSSAKQILQDQYSLGELFSLYFGSLALAVGLSSYVNSKLVLKYGMEKICVFSLSIMSGSSFIFFFYARLYSGQPHLVSLMSYLFITFFCFGTLFANMNTLAVQALGHIAGIASSVISSLQTLLAVSLGGVIGYFYNNTVLPLVGGFSLCGMVSLFIIKLVISKD